MLFRSEDNSYIGFWYNGNNKLIEDVALSLGGDYSSMKYDLGLALENIGIELGCSELRTFVAAQTEPWETLHYMKRKKENQEYYFKCLTPENN